MKQTGFQKAVDAMRADRVRCRWFALCTRRATTLRPGPAGDVPICGRCDRKVACIEGALRGKPR